MKNRCNGISSRKSPKSTNVNAVYGIKKNNGIKCIYEQLSSDKILFIAIKENIRSITANWNHKVESNKLEPYTIISNMKNTTIKR